MPPTKLTKATEKLFVLADVMETVWHKTTVHIYPVSDSQLAELTAGYNSIYLVFFGLCTGVLTSVAVTYPLITDAKLKIYYFSALLIFSGLAVMFGIVALERYVRASSSRRKLEKSPLLEPKIPT